MPRQSLAPNFPGHLKGSVAAASDFFYLLGPSAVPVETFTIEADGVSTEFVVDADRYGTAIFLLYCAVLAHQSDYAFTSEMRRLLPHYYSENLIRDARRKDTNHTALRLLIHGESVRIRLVLRAGYVLPTTTKRTVRELIEFAWHIREELAPERPAPLIREALSRFMKAVEKGEITIIESSDPNVWPSLVWMERVGTLDNRLQEVFAT